MAPSFKFFKCLQFDIRFQLQAVASVRKGASQQEPRSGQGICRSLSKVDQAGQEHRQSLRLSVGTLCSIDEFRCAVLKRNAWVQGVEG